MQRNVHDAGYVVNLSTRWLHLLSQYSQMDQWGRMGMLFLSQGQRDYCVSEALGRPLDIYSPVQGRVVLWNAIGQRRVRSYWSKQDLTAIVPPSWFVVPIIRLVVEPAFLKPPHIHKCVCWNNCCCKSLCDANQSQVNTHSCGLAMTTAVKIMIQWACITL